jgi:thioredoxin-dependent peroxiredoxin
MALPKVGDKAPDFKSVNQNGEEVSLGALKGQAVVLYFYPKDSTPGCTVEACEFRDGYAKLKKQAVLLGVSPDSAKSHTKFIEKFSLPFDLVVDEDKAIAKAYGVWVKKSMYGREYMGVARSTFVIGKDGKIARVFEKVTPKGHADEVLAAL